MFEIWRRDLEGQSMKRDLAHKGIGGNGWALNPEPESQAEGQAEPGRRAPIGRERP
jgi:hypothetical protein